MQKKPILLSGMRPTGPMHLGHLVGALNNWLKLQENYLCFFMVADWHALMSEYKDPQIIKYYTIDNVIDWLSVGIDQNRSVIFRQSDVKEHLELAMILATVTPLSWLERCPTYKEQIKQLKNKDIGNYAFLGYPVLQAADILLYKAEVVPIGEDQLPHLELTREIARRFNHLYKREVFVLPSSLLTQASRLLGIDNRKMSKSYNNYIALSEKPSEIRRKVLSMITDPKKIKKTDPGNPKICNVYTYHRIFTDDEMKQELSLKEIASSCQEGKLGCVECKSMLASKLTVFLEKIQEKRKSYNKEFVLEILIKGANKAKEVASSTLREVKSIVGIV